MYFTVWVVKQKRELQWKCRTAERYGPRGGAAWLTWNERMDSSNAGGPVLRQEEPQCWRRRAGIGFSVQKPWLWPVAGRKGPKEQPGWGRRHVVSWPLGGALQCRLAISMQFSSNCSYIAGRGGGGGDSCMSSLVACVQGSVHMCYLRFLLCFPLLPKGGTQASIKRWEVSLALSG